MKLEGNKRFEFGKTRAFDKECLKKKIWFEFSTKKD